MELRSGDYVFYRIPSISIFLAIACLSDWPTNKPLFPHSIVLDRRIIPSTDGGTSDEKDAVDMRPWRVVPATFAGEQSYMQCKNGALMAQGRVEWEMSD